MQSYSIEDFYKIHGGTPQTPTPRVKPLGFFADTKQDLIDTALGVGGAALGAFNKASDVIQNPRFNPIQKTTGILGAAAGGASNVFGEAVIGAGKAVLPQSAEDAVKKQAQEIIGGVITPETAKKVQEWYNKLDENNKLVVDSAGGIGQFMFDVVTLGTAKPVAMGAKTAVETGAQTTKQTAETAFKDALNLRTRVQEYVGKESVGPQVQESVTRLTKPTPTKVTAQSGGGAVMKPTFLEGTAQRAEDVVTKYDTYLAQSEKAINDIKADPAIAVVGEKMGDAFNDVARQTRAIGAQLGDELKEVGKLRVAITDAASKFITDLKESGLHYNPKTRDFMAPSGTAFADDEINMIQEFMNRMRLLGTSPTVRDINNFIARSRSELAFTKGKAGVMGTTNAERIINGALAGLRESTNPKVNGIQQLEKYFALNKTYSDLKDFLEEGGQFLGKKTQTGDYAKDASLAKSAVQSILNNGKKDWMLKLEALSGYNALDDAVLALQAMKDAGDYRGTSLLQVIKDGGLPTSKAGAVAQIVDYGVNLGKQVIAGKPSEQTRAFLQSLQKTAKVDLKVADKVVQAGKDVVKTKEITAIESKIAKNVAAQKVAIKAGDFTLVAKLKEAYQILVETLRKLVREVRDIKAERGGESGMIRNPLIADDLKQYKPTRPSNRNLYSEAREALAKNDGSNPHEVELLKNYVRGKEDSATRTELATAIDVLNGKAKPKSGVITPKTPTTMTASEAKKAGMTFEEWVKEQGDSFYHTTPAQFDKFDRKFLGENTNFDNAQHGFFFTDNLAQIEEFKNVLREGFGGGFVTDSRVKTAADIAKYRTIEKIAKKEDFFNFNYNAKDLTPKEARVFAEFADKKMGGLYNLDGEVVNHKKMTDKELNQFLKDEVFVEDLDPDSSFLPQFTEQYFGDFVKYLENKGYTGLVSDFANGKNEYMIFDPNKLKTRSQLRAEWDKAN